MHDVHHFTARKTKIKGLKVLQKPKPLKTPNFSAISENSCEPFLRKSLVTYFRTY